MKTDFVTLFLQDRKERLEYLWINPEISADEPTLVFLHEGLGSVALWRDFPERLCQHLTMRGLVYSRYAYGASSPRPHDEPFHPDYLRREATQVLPALLHALSVKKAWLIGHSDGGSIALLAAARQTVNLSGIVVIAPHYFVEDICLKGIARAKAAYEKGDLRQRLARYHQDADSAFYGWCNAWLNPDYKNWNIAADVEKITCPVLAVQGDEDEYATLEQIEGIKRLLPETELSVLPHCGHFPHLKEQKTLIHTLSIYIRAH